MHYDKLKTKPVTKKYVEGWNRIFGTNGTSGTMAALAKARKEKKPRRKRRK